MSSEVGEIQVSLYVHFFALSYMYTVVDPDLDLVSLCVYFFAFFRICIQ